MTPHSNAKEACNACDGHGIMTLFNGRTILAPCVRCSPNRKIEDLFKERAQRVIAREAQEERELIGQHNRRMAAMA